VLLLTGPETEHSESDNRGWLSTAEWQEEGFRDGMWGWSTGPAAAAEHIYLARAQGPRHKGSNLLHRIDGDSS
jgi:hypothetical protein